MFDETVQLTAEAGIDDVAESFEYATTDASAAFLIEEMPLPWWADAPDLDSMLRRLDRRIENEEQIMRLDLMSGRMFGVAVSCTCLVAIWILISNPSAFKGVVESLCWLGTMGVYIAFIPRIVRWADREDGETTWRSLVRTIVAWWGLLFGPLVGGVVGGIAGPFTEAGWSVLQGALLGMVIGSLESMLVMAAVVPIVMGFLWWHSRRSLRYGTP